MWALTSCCSSNFNHFSVCEPWGRLNMALLKKPIDGQLFPHDDIQKGHLIGHKMHCCSPIYQRHQHFCILSGGGCSGMRRRQGASARRRSWTPELFVLCCLWITGVCHKCTENVRALKNSMQSQRSFSQCGNVVPYFQVGMNGKNLPDCHHTFTHTHTRTHTKSRRKKWSQCQLPGALPDHSAFSKTTRAVP